MGAIVGRVLIVGSCVGWRVKVTMSIESESMVKLILVAVAAFAAKVELESSAETADAQPVTVLTPSSDNSDTSRKETSHSEVRS